MSIQISHEKEERILSIHNEPTFNRRKFIKYSSYVTLLPLLSMASIKEAEAFWAGLIGRGLVSLVARSVGRTVGRSISRGGVRRASGNTYGRSASYARHSTSSYGRRAAQAGTLSNIAPELLSMAAEIAAEAIWAQSSHYNDTILTIENLSEKTIATPIYISIRDEGTGNVEMERQFTLTTKPFIKHSFEFQIKDLPYTGIKRVYGEVNNTGVKCTPSGSIIVGENHQVIGIS